MFQSILNSILNFFKVKDTKFYYLSLLKDNNKWHIHGLWPQNSKDSYPSYCRTVEFDITKLNTILNKLNENWYSLDEKNELFWSHEWKKHGSCMFSDIDEFTYFNKSLELFEKVKDMGIIEKYKNGKKSLIPFDLDFNLIKN